MSDDNKYPDTHSPNGEVVRLFGRKKTAPAIKWGSGYLNRSDQDKISYLEKLASSLNDALSEMQDDRNRLSKIAFSQETQLRQAGLGASAQSDMLQQQITRWNADKEERLQRVQALQAQVREQAARIKDLEAMSGSDKETAQ